MKLKPFVKALAATLVSVGALSAQATTYNKGAVTIGIPMTFAGVVANGLFSDVFTFTLPANGGSGYSVADFTLIPGTYQTVFATMSLLTDPNGSVAAGGGFSGDEVILHSEVTSGSTVSFAYAPTSGGSMLLAITGYGVGTSGGIYTGAISASAVTPVPEPESYAMLLAGLGVMGAIALRRNRNKSE